MIVKERKKERGKQQNYISSPIIIIIIIIIIITLGDRIYISLLNVYIWLQSIILSLEFVTKYGRK